MIEGRAIFVAGRAAVVEIGDSWIQLLLAVGLAIATTQVAFLGHDAGHRQVFRRRGASDLAGLLAGNLAVGLSYGWWIDKHNRHHANPNHGDEDPDVGAGALVWAEEQALVWAEEQALATRGAGRWLARRQAYLFFPLLFLEGLALHVASVRAILGRTPGGTAGRGGFVTPMRHRRLELLLLVVHTSRNVRGGWFVDVALGGLNYQVEHRLFPNMPRANLRRAQPIVRDNCAERGIPYTETGLVESYRQALGHLHVVGRPLRLLG